YLAMNPESSHSTPKTGTRPVHPEERKRVVVTGASRGIGRAVAQAFADEGAAVLLVARDTRTLQETAASCGARAAIVAADLARSEGCGEVVAEAHSVLGYVDVFVHAAGIAESAPFLRTTDSLWRRTMDIDVDSAFRLVQGILPAMLER